VTFIALASRSATARSFRATFTINNEETQVLVEETSAVASEWLGDFVGRVTIDELREMYEALRLALELD
jgi:mRNA interferase MazF